MAAEPPKMISSEGRTPAFGTAFALATPVTGIPALPG
jgi:hypothetical protein